MVVQANSDRYENMTYNSCGQSGIRLPAVSLGLWHNFGGVDRFENGRDMIVYAFNAGITHFDLANNYGPPYGTAEETFGKIFKKDLAPYRDEMIISTKAGYWMWPGPYGDGGSKKYLKASLDQSLRRMGLDYVDIFYHHRWDAYTPLEETMETLALLVQQGKTLYVGVSNYSPEQTVQAVKILETLGLKCLIHQVKYSMLERSPENGLLDVLEKYGIGCIAFSPLAQGLLTNKYIRGIPPDSRAASPHGFLKSDEVTLEKIEMMSSLDEIAKARGQDLAQMAIAWLLKDKRVTSVLIGASRVSQIENCLGTSKNLAFSKDELSSIDKIIRSLSGEPSSL